MRGHSAIEYIFPTFELWVFLHRPRFFDQRTLHLPFGRHVYLFFPPFTKPAAVVRLRPDAHE